MAQFLYVAEAVDGKNAEISGMLNATDRQDAEKQVKALITYPVKISLEEVSPALAALLGKSWGSATEKVVRMDIDTKT